MIKERADEWIAALRSGKYTQITGALHKDNGFCCLGVACDISGLGEWKLNYDSNENPTSKPQAFWDVQGKRNRKILPECVMEYFGINDSTGLFYNSDSIRTELTNLNDTSRLSFNEIADVIEKNWERL